jgi:hypothetical protein
MMRRGREGPGRSQRLVMGSCGTCPYNMIVNLALVAIWYYSGAGFPWPIFPIFFWGLGVFAHYMSAYRSSGGGWIERETEKILRREDETGKP